MPMIVAVTGYMRSGTSPVSRMLHELGIPMGNKMCFPLNPDSHLEWEDSAFSEAMLNFLINRVSEDDIALYMKNYIENRSRDNEQVADWGVKTPFLLPYVTVFRRVAEDAGYEFNLVVTKRDYTQTLQSLKYQMRFQKEETLNFALNVQFELVKYYSAAASTADLIVNIEETWNAPESVRKKLLELTRR